MAKEPFIDWFVSLTGSLSYRIVVESDVDLQNTTLARECSAF